MTFRPKFFFFDFGGRMWDGGWEKTIKRTVATFISKQKSYYVDLGWSRSRIERRENFWKTRTAFEAKNWVMWGNRASANQNICYAASGMVYRYSRTYLFIFVCSSSYFWLHQKKIQLKLKDALKNGWGAPRFFKFFWGFQWSTKARMVVLSKRIQPLAI